jgi:hypothetical protein|tara:strand:- start:4077 stop:4784 length:708 start_codon:yes stop_codon:yes gene_type:complete
MSGIDYDGLDKHSKEVDSKQKEYLAFEGVETEADFFQHLSRNETNSGKKQIRLYALSVPLEYSELFMDTVYEDFMKATSKKLRIGHVTSFAYHLRTHQSSFFGEEEVHGNNRSLFVDGAIELSIMDSLSDNNFGTSIGNYALLIGCVEDKKLDFYRQKVLRAKELNGNFVSSVSNGLVAVLQNLSLPNANLFTSEAFELMRPEGGGTPGLSDARAYITLKTDSAINRMQELLDNQ